MGSKNWQHLAFAAAVAFGLAACETGGDAMDETTAEETTMEQPATTGQPGTGQAATGTVPEGATAEQVAQGRQIFTGAGNCFTCHGQEARGTQLAPDLTDDTWVNVSSDPSLDEVIQLVRTGVAQPVEHPSPMPPMGGGNLTDEQIRAVSAYVLSL